MIAFFLSVVPTAFCREVSPKFLIIHLDAVSSSKFFQYMEEEYLPNTKAIFKEGHAIKYGLSLFPGGTENIIPRLKEGLGNETGENIGWGYYNREKGREVSGIKSFSNLFSAIPRRAQFSMLYGLPVIDSLMFLPMMNIPQLLETYGVIQLYWFSPDAAGHVFGEKIYLNSIRRFDRYLGRLVKRLNLDEVNLILYCDHGMALDNEIVIDHVPEINRVLGDGLESFFFPNVYLKDLNLKEYYAQKIVQETKIDFTFYKENGYPDIVRGYSIDSKVIFQENGEGKIRYLFEGKDEFSYYTDGYQGEWLSADEWLILTRKSKFPAVPPNIFGFLSNKNAGDIVLVVNPPHLIFTNLIFDYTGNHHGVTDMDLLVPILLRGKELEHLYDREEMWLHTLFTSIPNLSFYGSTPERENHSLSLWGNLKDGEFEFPGFELTLSPHYRWNLALRHENDITKGWFEYDVYSSYVIRLWAGAGVEYRASENSWEPFLQSRLQMDFDRIQFNYGGQVNLNNFKEWQENRKEISCRINKNLYLNWQIPNRLGFTLHW